MKTDLTAEFEKGTTVKTCHISVNIEGVLRWSDHDLIHLFITEDGEHRPAREIREWLKLQIAKGRRVLPFGEPCEGWNYQTGCPGHPHE